jgi:hypothetical protein
MPELDIPPSPRVSQPPSRKFTYTNRSFLANTTTSKEYVYTMHPDRPKEAPKKCLGGKKFSEIILRIM